jgi:hypothetical protein
MIGLNPNFFIARSMIGRTPNAPTEGLALISANRLHDQQHGK